jgi:hypothetical protein
MAYFYLLVIISVHKVRLVLILTGQKLYLFISGHRLHCNVIKSPICKLLEITSVIKLLTHPSIFFLRYSKNLAVYLSSFNLNFTIIHGLF